MVSIFIFISILHRPAYIINTPTKRGLANRQKCFIANILLLQHMIALVSTLFRYYYGRQVKDYNFYYICLW